MRILSLLVVASAVSGAPIGCSSPADTSPSSSLPDAAAPVKAPELGKGDHSPTSVTLTEIVVASAGLTAPRDLAFNPLRPDELWVVNKGDESALIVHGAGTQTQTTERRKDSDAAHFMPNPEAIAFGQDETSFGASGTFATCGESRDTMDDTQKADDFMGPTLWSSDLSIFAKKNPHNLGSHLDMLHNTPLCMGITHETANRYWVFGGLKNSIDLYDFKQDHNIGQDDHSDGESYQYLTGQVKYVPGIPSHLVYREADAMVYFSDTGNGRIAKLDSKSGKTGKPVKPKEKMAVSVMMDDATVVDVVPASAGLKAPSGIEIYKDSIYVSDNATSRITAFTLEGEQVNYLDTGLPAGSLSGMAFGPDGKLYLVDIIGNRVLRIDSNVE